MNEKRKAQRILVTGLVYELNGNFLGVYLDLNRSGIRLTVSKNFPHFHPFSIELRPIEGEEFPSVTLKIKPLWYKDWNRAYDEIGAKIIQVEQEQQWQELLKWYAENEKVHRSIIWKN
jgi:hypothetical protein